MSIVTTSVDSNKKVQAILLRTNVDKKGNPTDEVSLYSPTEPERDVIALIRKHFTYGAITMSTPRVEFNDLSVGLRDQYDQMAWNTYQPNNGEALEGDALNGWRSRAIRPVVRNKAVSIAAHATARLIFPKVFAYDESSQTQRDAAQVMESLMEWAGEESNYAYTALSRVITALYSPASIGYTEYAEVMRMVKTEKDDQGNWIEKRVRDLAYPCFQDQTVPVDQLYIENFFEPDIQKQGWLIWRKVYSFSLAQGKYNTDEYPNFKYVKPGVQLIYDDANKSFYNVYDPNMRMEDVEEITYWNRLLDLKIILVNGVMLTACDNPNPRLDKLYPFDKFGYELINNRCFYYKSLAFKLMHDSEILNTLYQMVIDGTYLSIFRPMVNVGGEMIASDVIVPGAVTTLSDPNADLRAINLNSDLNSGFKALETVQDSINDSSQDQVQQGQQEKSGTTAYEISRLEQNANTVLGLFIQMIVKHVKDFGTLRKSDILQYMTVPDVIDITDNAELVYKTFLLTDKSTNGKTKGKRIQFSSTQKDEMTDDQYLKSSYDVLEEEQKEENMQIYKVNPSLFRDLTYMVTVSPDVLAPRSQDLERAYDLETYDKLIQNPMAAQDEALRLLLATNRRTSRDPDKFIMKPQQGQATEAGAPVLQPGQTPPNQPQQMFPSTIPKPPESHFTATKR